MRPYPPRGNVKGSFLVLRGSGKLHRVRFLFFFMSRKGIFSKKKYLGLKKLPFPTGTHPPFQRHTARRGNWPTAAPAWRVAVALVPSIVPDGNRDTITQTPTHGSGAVDIGGLQPSLGAVAPAAARPTRSTSRASTDMLPGGTANAYKTSS